MYRVMVMLSCIGLGRGLLSLGLVSILSRSCLGLSLVLVLSWPCLGLVLSWSSLGLDLGLSWSCLELDLVKSKIDLPVSCLGLVSVLSWFVLVLTWSYPDLVWVVLSWWSYLVLVLSCLV